MEESELFSIGPYSFVDLESELSLGPFAGRALVCREANKAVTHKHWLKTTTNHPSYGGQLSDGDVFTSLFWSGVAADHHNGIYICML